LADLSLLAISHLHPDHVADLPALLWLSEAARQQPLRIAGPSGAGIFPGFDAFIARLFDQKSGAFPILSGTLGQAGRGIPLDVIQVAAGVGTASTVLADSVMQITALGVPHADVPSIAYRVQVGNRIIVFGSDQNGTDSRFSQFASGADLLLMHFGISERAPDELARLHARPATVGQIAHKANARQLVLSHFMQPPPTVRTPEWFSLFDLDQAIAEVRKHFAGPIEAAVDLQCIEVR
jgi:ribonuclease BN (tRNA processing enzyme)